MSSKTKAKRKNKCPGCGTPKDIHDFAAMGKHCEGPDEPDPASDDNMEKSPVEEENTLSPVPGDKQDALLQAIRALSSQVEALQLEQKTLRDTVTDIKASKDKIGGGASTQEPSARADNNNSDSTVERELQLPPGQSNASGHVVSGTLLKAVKAGNYVDFVDLLPRKVKPETCGDVPGTGNQKTNATQNLTIESFDSWLEAWNIYEALVLDVEPLRYKELARYRDVIQKANRKFVWSAVYNYDVQFRLRLTINTSARFDTVDTTLYTTILDSSAVRKEGISCQRCKSPNHLVRDCLFRAKTALEENQSAKKTSSHTRPDSGQQTNNWKYYKWFTSTGKEGCNLFQRNSCQQGTECKRAHVCKACRGEHSLADCKYVTGH